MATLLKTSEITSKISGIKRTTKALRANIQTVLVNSAAHVYEHGDVTLYAKLFDATSGANRKLLVKWIEAYGFARIQKDGTFKKNKKATAEADFNGKKEVAFAYLNEHAPLWHEKESDAPAIARELNLVKRMQSLIASAEKDDATVTPVDLDEYRKLREQLDEVMERHSA